MFPREKESGIRLDKIGMAALLKLQRGRLSTVTGVLIRHFIIGTHDLLILNTFQLISAEAVEMRRGIKLFFTQFVHARHLDRGEKGT